MTKKKIAKKKKPIKKETGKKKAAKKAAVKKAAVKKTPKKSLQKKKVAKKTPLKKQAVPKKPAIKKEPLPANAIPLTIPLGDVKFNGWLLPQEKLTAWGMPETFTVHITGQGADSSVSIATGVWAMPGNLPPQILQTIITTIEKFYNNKNNNT